MANAVPAIIEYVVIPATMYAIQQTLATRPIPKTPHPLGITGSTHGLPLPKVWGLGRVPGNVVWASDLVEFDRPGGNKKTGSTRGLRGSFALALCEGPIVWVRRIWADGSLIYSRMGGENLTTDKQSTALESIMAVYTGNSVQTPDPTIAAAFAADKQPNANRDVAYLVFTDMDVTCWGRIPTFQVEVMTAGDYGVPEGGTWPVCTPTPVDVGIIIADLCARAGIDPGDLDLTPLPLITVDGYQLDGQVTVADALKPLQAFFALDVVEQAPAGLRFQPRSAPTIVTVLAGDVAAADESRSGVPVSITRVPIGDLPSVVSVRYIDATLTGQTGLAQVRQDHLTRNHNEVTLDFPGMVSADKARAAADLLMKQHWYENGTYQVSLPPLYLAVEPGDVLDLTAVGPYPLIRVVTIDLGANGRLEVTGTPYHPALYSSTLLGATGPDAPGTLNAMDEGQLILADCPALRDVDAIPGVYVVAGPRYTSVKRWRFGSLWRSADAGVTWREIYSQAGGAAIGSLVNGPSWGTLDSASYYGPSQVWDDQEHLDVEIHNWAPTGATDDEVIHGANYLLVIDPSGNLELLQYGVVTPQGGHTYRLTHLLRNRRGTDAWASAGSHLPTATVVFMDTVNYLPLNSRELGTEYLWKMVPNGLSLADVDALPFAPGFVTLKPWAVVNVHGTRDGSSNLTVTWMRRSRLGQELPDGTSIPLGEQSERYQLLFTHAGTTVEKWATSEAYTYSAADQTTDWGAPIGAGGFQVAIRQVSDIVGPGLHRPTTWTI